MRLPQDYDPEPVVAAVTALDWSTEHPYHAVRAIQAIVRIKFGEKLSEEDSMQFLRYLLDRQFIRTQVQPDESKLTGWRQTGRAAKYVRVPSDER
jgi:hypothetical protein